jgi:ligand-binding SRPBCC domain-containing protein
VPELVLKTLIAAPPEECFRLSLSVDAHTASMGRSKERAVAGVTAGEMSLGQSVTWRATHFGIPFRMTSVISEYERPHRFVDEQFRGAFKRWWHEHLFAARDEGTEMTDACASPHPLVVSDSSSTLSSSPATCAASWSCATSG